MAAIKTTGLRKQYGDFVALDDLDLEVEEGEVFGFLGPNGAGKTTTIDILLDFIRPTAGSAEVFGHDVQAETDAVRDRMGILPDGFDLWKRSSGYRHLEFAIDSKGAAADDPDELLDRVGLDEADARRKVGGYSKGMMQRLAMAMALVGDPDLLILDEPSTGLDPHGIQTMQNIVREEAASGTTVFFSSHILGQVSSICDRVGILEDGELVTVDTIQGLRESAGVGSKLVLEVDGQPSADLTSVHGVTDVTAEAGRLTVTYTDDRTKADVIHRIVQSGGTVEDFRVEEAQLNDLFDSFTTDEVAEPEVDEPGDEAAVAAGVQGDAARTEESR